ncbi:MAG: Flp pilus assembly protein CpaB [Bdellovibrionales bacterium]|nr:Flp pilus assembly protein CpaB [Bdellovibrionales bacterium]
MGGKFGRHYPVVGKSHDRERLLFIAALGLTFSLLIILVVVFKVRGNSSETAANDYPEMASEPAAQAGVATVTLLAPERTVRSGTKLSDVQFKKMYWPRNQVPEGAIRDEAEVRAYYAKTDLEPGVPLQRRHLTREAQSAMLSITPGNRATTISIDAEKAIEYHVIPGSHVDVVLTYYQAGELTSKVLVQNARVLSLGGDTSIGDDMQRRGASRRRLASQTVTLDVSPQDALKIATSKQLGKLSLLMRSGDDVKPSPVNEVNQTDIGSGVVGGSKRQSRSCKRGTIKIQGKGEFLLDCDGSMTPINDSLEP